MVCPRWHPGWVTGPDPLIELLNISPEGQAVFITHAVTSAPGYEDYSYEERRHLLLGYILGLSVGMNANQPFAKAELASRIDELNELMRKGDDPTT